MHENPYAPPDSAELARLDADRDAISFGRAVLMVLTTTGIGSMIGTAIGFFIGTIAPEFFPVLLFRTADAIQRPTTFGAAIGLANGVFCGAAIGVVLVGVVAWHRVRIARLRQSLLHSPSEVDIVRSSL
jgi:hypothetical protein